MTRRIVLQHRTSKRYLAAQPSPESTGVHEVVAPINAAHFTTEELAERERHLLGEFKDTYKVEIVDLEAAR